jgi:hypothetical protein
MMTKPPTPKPDAKEPERTPEQINRRLWDQLCKTDPQATKGFKRAGGFSGTAIKPMWINKRLTEIFGPAGIGWGTDEPTFTTVVATEGEVLVYCHLAGWYVDPATPGIREHRKVFGIGGDKCVAKVGRGTEARMVADDEAFKKAFTDALGNAFKFVGVAADVHMGLFDDSKYVAEINQEFRANEDTLGKEADALEQQIRECTDLKVLIDELLPVATEIKQKLDAERRQAEGVKLVSTFNARKANLQAKAKAALEDEPEKPADQS